MKRRRLIKTLQRKPRTKSSTAVGLVELLEGRLLLSGSPLTALAGMYAQPTVLTLAQANDAGGGVSPASVSPITPTEMRTAYGISQIAFGSVTGNGAGQTIAIIDAYHDATIIPDANFFSQYYGLPQFNGSGEPTLQVLNENGGTALPTTTSGDWPLEESLDVEWAHAIAPDANIIVYEANSSNYPDLLTAAQTAAGTTGVSVVSMSFSGGEWSTESSTDSFFVTPTGHPGVTFLASTGDSGAPAGYPAYSPNVVAVGGTSLDTDTSGDYLSETAWSSGGGGVSLYESQPSYQTGKVNGTSSTMRTAPDVSMDASPSTGVNVYLNGSWSTVGGTSLSCPMWAGLMSIVDQGRALDGLSSLDGATQTLPMLYNLPSSDFHDITSGNNGYAATTGYDLATGLGTPVANLLVPDMVSKSPQVTAPSTASVSENSTITFSTGNGNAISVADGFAGSSSQLLTLSVSDGSLTLASGSGVTVTSGANGSGTMTIKGTLTQIDNALNGLVYTPKSNYSGSDSLVLSYVDSVGGGSLTGSGSVALTVSATSGQSPAITSTNHATFTVGTAGTFTVTATGSPAPTFGETGTLPTGITFNTTTGVLSGTPGAGTGGTYTVTITASNGVGTAASQTFTLTIDQAPAITSANNATFTAGTAGSFTVTASGFPGDTFSETGTLPSGLSFNTTTGVLSGTPGAGTGGTYTVTFTASNGIGTQASQTFTLTIDQAAAITSANHATLTAGTAGSFTVTASGFPSSTFGETGTLPSGLSFNTSTGVLSGTPAAGTGGTYTVTFTASNGVGTQASQTFTLTIDQAAAITSSNSSAFTVGTAGSFTVTASGFPGATFGETGTLPSGLSFNSSTGVLSGTPGAGTGGTYTVTFTASNGVGTQASQTFTLTVDQAAAVTSANNATFTVGSAGSFTVTASGFPAATFSETGTLPSGLSFNSSTGVLSGTAGAGTGGTYSLTFTASNGVGTQASQTFTLTVDQGVAITSANQATFTVGTAGSFTVTASGFPAETFSETGTLPSGLSFNTSTGVLSGTPGAGTGGTYSLTFTASNGIGTQASQTFTLTVDQAPAITSANHATFTAGSAGSFTVTGSGFPGVTFGETGSLPAGLSFNTTSGVLSGTPGAGTGGNYTVTFSASNGVGTQASQSFTLAIDQAAAITSASNAALTVGTSGSFTVTASGFPSATFGESGTLPAGLTFNTATGVLSGTPAAGDGGTYPLTFTANNGIGTAASQSFTLTIDQAPAITSAINTTLTVGTAGSFTVTASGFPAATFGETGILPAGLSFNTTTGVLSGTPVAGDGGSYALTITASNGVGQQASQTFTLAVDEAPAITSASSTTFSAGAASSFAVTSSGFPAATFSESGALPSGLTFNSNTGVLSGTPVDGSGGTYDLTFTASNGIGQQASQSFTLTVTNVMEAPQITSASGATFAVGSAGSFTVVATGYPSPTLSETGVLPTGLSFNSSTGVLSGTPGAGTTGVYTVTFTASNGIGQPVNQTFALTVDQAASITSANSATFTVGSAGSFTVTATGSPVANFGESGALPAGLSFDPTTGILSGTAAAGTGGTYTVTFSASNGVGQPASQTFTLTVDEQPAVTSAGSTTFTAGTVGSFTVTTSGFPSSTFGDSGALPAGVTFNTATGVLSGSPSAGTGGSYSFTVTASNGIGQEASQTFTLTVDEAPTITSANGATFTVGSGGSFIVTASGFPGATFGESAALPAGLSFDAATGTLSGTPANGTRGTYNLTFTAINGIGQDASQSFTLIVQPAPASQLAFIALPTTGSAGHALSSAVKVAVEDQFGNVVTTDNSTVTLTLANGVFSTGSSTATVQAVNGVATFSGLIVNTAGSETFLASDGSLASATSNAVTVSPAAASKLAFVQLPATGTAGQALAPVQVAVEDAYGNVITSNKTVVTIAVHTGPQALVKGSTLTATAVNGVATFSNLILDLAGTYTLTVSDGTLAKATSAAVAVSATTPSKVVLLKGPSAGSAGQAITPTVSAAVEDRFGNVVTSDGSTVTALVHGGPAGFAAGSVTQVAAVNGVANFNYLVFDKAGTYSLGFGDGSLTVATSSNFVVSPAVASQIVLQAAPTGGTAGTALSATKAAVEDQFGNIVTSYKTAVSVSVQSGPAGFGTGTTASVAPVNGVATFTRLIFNQAGTYVIGVGGGSLSGVATGNIAVNPAAASKLALVQAPSGAAVAGQALSPSLSVAVEDRFGNVVTSNGSTVSVALHAGPAGFAGGSTTAVAAVNGIATFNNLMLTKTGTYSFTAIDGALARATTSNITLSPAVASKLVFVGAPTAATAGQAFNPTVKVAVEDAFGNVVTGDNSTITLSPNSGTFAGGAPSVTAQAVNGVATFSGLTLDAAGTNLLSASDGSLAGAATGNITVKAAAASQLVFLQTPVVANASQPLNPGVQVAIEDAFGNIVTTSNSTVTLSVLSGPGSFAKGSTVSVAAVKGVATFNNLVLDATGDYSFSASDGTMTHGVSSAIQIGSTDVAAIDDYFSDAESSDLLLGL